MESIVPVRVEEEPVFSRRDEPRHREIRSFAGRRRTLISLSERRICRGPGGTAREGTLFDPIFHQPPGLIDAVRAFAKAEEALVSVTSERPAGFHNACHVTEVRLDPEATGIISRDFERDLSSRVRCCEFECGSLPRLHVSRMNPCDIAVDWRPPRRVRGRPHFAVSDGKADGAILVDAIRFRVVGKRSLPAPVSIVGVRDVIRGRTCHRERVARDPEPCGRPSVRLRKGDTEWVMLDGDCEWATRDFRSVVCIGDIQFGCLTLCGEYGTPGNAASGLQHSPARQWRVRIRSVTHNNCLLSIV